LQLAEEKSSILQGKMHSHTAAPPVIAGCFSFYQRLAADGYTIYVYDQIAASPPAWLTERLHHAAPIVYAECC
jgi:hypothetical protein